MKYQRVHKATFLSRPNRFIAKVLLNGKEETVHVKNTGRCKELLQKGVKVYLSQEDSPLRKTRYDLIAVEKTREDGRTFLINMDSQIPNSVVAEWLPQSGLFSAEAQIKREVCFGESRFDLFVCDGERKAFLEVKGVTLEKEGLAMFPDAPTLRGVKHIQELMKAMDEGYEAYLVFLVQMKGIFGFSPNEKTDPVFARTLVLAQEKGVGVLCLDCQVSPDTLEADKYVKLLFGSESQDQLVTIDHTLHEG